jgi:nucleotide-binding universal stress UspA family protein
MRLQRILVPVDFSPQSEQAAIIAVEIAGRHQAAVTLLHVDPFPGMAAVAVEPVYIPPDLFTGLRADYDRRIDDSFERLQAVLRTYQAPGVIVRVERRTSGVTEGILEFAREWDADLIAMGSSGLSGAARLLLGSVTEKVSRDASCAVLITRARDDEERPLQPFHRILVGIDYSRFSVPVAHLARSVAAPTAELELVHVWSPPYVSALNTHLGGIETTEWVNAVERARAIEAQRLESFAAENELGETGCFVGAGNVPTALLDRADEVNADLLVLGAHSRRDLRERLLGTTSDRLLRHARITVLLMPEEALMRWTIASAPTPRLGQGVVNAGPPMRQ